MCELLVGLPDVNVLDVTDTGIRDHTTMSSGARRVGGRLGKLVDEPLN